MGCNAQTFFYDPQTSGLEWSRRPRHAVCWSADRHDLNPIGEPYNVLVALNDDTLPSPDALMVTIIPQQTKMMATEAQFAQLLLEEVFTSGHHSRRSISVSTMNLYAFCHGVFAIPAEWAWRDGLLTVGSGRRGARMTRALRPEGHRMVSRCRRKQPIGWSC